jgi:6-pyruvoyltetrahydropterin/6-carboxytetrahydropterin synthase
LYIDGWKVNIRFSSAHILPTHKKCDVLHGHSYAIHCKVYGKKNEEGMVLDFNTLKSNLREIADTLDHKVLIPEKNRYVKVLKEEVEICKDSKRYVFPLQDCALLPIENVTAENLSEYILQELLDKMDLPRNVEKIEIGVDEGLGQGASCQKKLSA